MNRDAGHRVAGVPAHVFWPGVVIALMSISVVAMTTTMVLAISDPSFALVKDYEAKANDWNTTAALRHASEALGWSAALAIGDMEGAAGGRALTVTLRDAAGAPISDALMRVVVFHPARSRERQTITLHELDTGVYTGEFSAAREGLWEFELMAERDADRFIDHRQQWVLHRKGR